ncbi:MAG: prepilin peptidase [Pseudomonadota bacterium]
MSVFLLQILILGVFPAAMAFAAASDLVTMTISNWLQIVLIVAFGLIAILAQLPLETIGYHLLAFFVVLAISFFCFARGWIGGGDAKLAACTALWFGWAQALYDYILLAAILGGVLTLALLYFRRQTLPQRLANQNWIMRLHDEKQGIPYGIALAASALIVYSETALFMLVVH